MFEVMLVKKQQKFVEFLCLSCVCEVKGRLWRGGGRVSESSQMHMMFQFQSFTVSDRCSCAGQWEGEGEKSRVGRE